MTGDCKYQSSYTVKWNVRAKKSLEESHKRGTYRIESVWKNNCWKTSTDLNKDVIVDWGSLTCCIHSCKTTLPLKWESLGNSSGNSLCRHHRWIVQIIFQTSDGNCVTRSYCQQKVYWLASKQTSTRKQRTHVPFDIPIIIIILVPATC